MSECIRVKLEFRGFSNEVLRRSLFSFRKDETKDVKSLHQLIQRKYELKPNICLFIDNFVLETTDSIDIIRDNDLIVVQPKVEHKVVVKSEPKAEPNVEKKYPLITSKYSLLKPKDLVTSDSKPKPKVKIGPKSRVQREVSPELGFNYISKSLQTPKPIAEHKAERKTEPKVEHKARKSFPTNSSQSSTKSGHKMIEKEIVNKTPVKSEIKLNVKPIDDSNVEVISVRNIPLRKAFQTATNAFKPQPVKREAVSEASSSQTPKPKRKRNTKEATEPMDRFSPFIILKRQSLDVPKPESIPITRPLIADKVQKRSARKTFPVPHKKDREIAVNENTSDLEIIVEKKIISLKTIDCNNCQALTSIPRVGDIIAFKMMTLSSNGLGYESSPFNKGSVLYVNTDTQMVDILLEGVLNRQNSKEWQKTGEEIHSLKINWSTVLEPKLIQSATDSQITI